MKKTALQYSMLIGSVYDCIFGILILSVPAFLARIIQLDMPQEEIYLRLCGLFLMIIGAFYLLLWMDQQRFKPVLFLAIAARASGFIFFFIAWFLFKYPFTFLLLGIGDGLFSAIHFALGIREKKLHRL